MSQSAKIAERIRIDRESEANHDLIRLLNKPCIICDLFLYIGFRCHILTSVYVDAIKKHVKTMDNWI